MKEEEILEQVKIQPEYIKNLPDHLINSIEFAEKVLNINSKAIAYFSNYVLSDFDFMLKAVSIDGDLIQIAKNGLNINNDIIMASIFPNEYRNSWNIQPLKYIDKKARMGYNVLSRIINNANIGMDIEINEFIEIFSKFDEVNIANEFFIKHFEEFNVDNQKNIIQYKTFGFKNKDLYKNFKDSIHNIEIIELLEKRFKKFENEIEAEALIQMTELEQPLIEKNTKSIIENIFKKPKC